jgi:hypothetical protein
MHSKGLVQTQISLFHFVPQWGRMNQEVEPPKYPQRSNMHMITVIYVFKDELKALQMAKQTTHYANGLFSCLCVSNRQQSSTLLYMP